jgi:FAD/FMN-containing dehydrogenase
VRAAVRFARTHDVLTSVRGGGHSIPGHSVCEGGLMIDLSLMKGVRVDAEHAVARAQPGVKWGEFDRETARADLATPGGYVSSTGIAGLTLGGGIGWLSRLHGLTCDNLLAADVVTADGELVRASADENPELFWGLRGGGGNFGIVTSFEYRLHPLSTVLGGALVYDGRRTEEVLAQFAEFALAAPDELTMLGLLITGPRHPSYPEHMRGMPVVFLGVCYAGDPAAGAALLDGFRAQTRPDLDFVREMSYAKLQRMLDNDATWGVPWYEKATYARDITPEAIATFSEHWTHRVSERDQMYMQQMGGQISRVPEDATPFGNRGTEFVYMIMSGWKRGQDPAPHVEWARSGWAAMQPYGSGQGVYVNFDSEDDPTRVRATYGPKYERLGRLKGRYDPTNLFRLNQNIEPIPN